MIFGKNKCVHSDSHIYIDNVELEKVSSTKFLGVIIDDKLNWNKQIQHVKNKIAKSISIMYKVKYFLEEAALLTVYSSLVLPYLNYCVEIWGNTYKSNLKGVITLQKRAVRIVGKVEYSSPTNPIFYKFRLLKLLDIIKLNTCVIMFKAYNNLLNRRLAKRFVLNKSATRQGNKFYVQYKRTKLKSFSISCCGVSLWNGLDSSLREIKIVTLSKKHIKLVFLEAYNN